MYYCCTGIAKCCNKTCDCINDTFGGCCKAINNCFSRPFSLCTCATFTFISIPGLIIAVMGAMALEDLNNNCKNPIFAFMAVQALLLILHGCFVLYLSCKYGEEFQKGHGNKNHNGTDKSIWDKISHFLCMDVVACLYFFLFIFQLVWSVMGSAWVSGDTPQCKDVPETTYAYFMLTLFWTWLVVGLVLTLFTLFCMAIDEGSCSCASLTYCCIACITCGVCNPKVSQKSREKRRIRRQQSGGHGKGVLRFFGFGCGSADKQKKYKGNQSNNLGNQNFNNNYTNYGGNNNNNNNYNNNNYAANNNNNYGAQNQNQNQQSYNYPPQNPNNQRPRKKKGFFSKFFG